MNNEVRQLRNELSELSDNIERASKCNEISRNYLYRDLDMVDHYAHLALNHLVAYEFHKEKGRAFLNLGASNFLRQNLVEGVRHYAEALKHVQNDIESQVRIYMGIGINYTFLFSYEKALIYEEKALKLAIQENLTAERVAIYNNMAGIYSYLNEYDLADHYFQQGLILATEKHFNRQIGYLYVGIIRNHLRAKRVYDGEKYLLKLEMLMESTGEMWFIGICKTLWALYYLSLDDTIAAKDSFEMGIDILKEEEQAYYLSLAYYDYLNLIVDKERYMEAKYLFYDYYQCISQMEIQPAFTGYYSTIAKYYSHIGDVANYSAFSEQFKKKQAELLELMNTYF